jgi:hypothetical protein
MEADVTLEQAIGQLPGYCSQYQHRMFYAACSTTANSSPKSPSLATSSPRSSGMLNADTPAHAQGGRTSLATYRVLMVLAVLLSGCDSSAISHPCYRFPSSGFGGAMADPTVAEKLHSYMSFRAEKEGVAHKLTVDFYQHELDRGIRLFFGVQVRGDRLIADEEQPALFREWQRPN